MANLSKRTTPMMGKLSELLVSGKRFGLLEAGPRPELAIQSPRGLKNYDLGVVGLGIVAALEKSGDHVLLAKHSTAAAAATAQSRSRSRSNPIPVKSRDCYRRFGEDDDDEDYTFVTCHGLNDKSYTKVYYDGGEIARASISSVKNKRTTNDSQKRNNDIFSITSTSCKEDTHSQSLFPASDFLSSCHLCKKKLHGKDIYMYRYYNEQTGDLKLN